MDAFVRQRRRSSSNKEERRYPSRRRPCERANGRLGLGGADAAAVVRLGLGGADDAAVVQKTIKKLIPRRAGLLLLFL